MNTLNQVSVLDSDKQQNGLKNGYLYGDSTPSPLNPEFFVFIRGAFDFAVKVLLNEGLSGEAARRAAELMEAADRDIESAELLGASVARTLERAVGSDRQSLAARCAARIWEGTKTLVKAETDAARAAAVAQRAQILESTSGMDAACEQAVRTLLLEQDIPGAGTLLNVRLAADGTHYVAESRGVTPFGFAWILALEIPGAHPFARPLRIDRVMSDLVVDAPEEGGWLHKEVKIRSQRFDRLHLKELLVAPEVTTIKLRVSPEGVGIGFDITFSPDGQTVQLLRITDGQEGTELPYDVVGDSVERLQVLRKTLVDIAMPRGLLKRSVASSTLDGKALDKAEVARLLVERLIANIASAVEQLSRRSTAPDELVLRRLLSDNQREEVFLSKADLLKKVETLPPAARAVFAPLEPWALPIAPAARVEPAPATPRFSPFPTVILREDLVAEMAVEGSIRATESQPSMEAE